MSNSENRRRKSISPKTRFEVFKRDGFTCKYCGRRSPDTVLEVDHVTPVSSGGHNGQENLVTSCFYCNRGKGASGIHHGERIDEFCWRTSEMLRKEGERLYTYDQLDHVILFVIGKCPDHWSDFTKASFRSAIMSSMIADRFLERTVSESIKTDIFRAVPDWERKKKISCCGRTPIPEVQAFCRATSELNNLIYADEIQCYFDKLIAEGKIQ